MVYKKGPKYQVRKAEEIIEDLYRAKEVYGNRIQTIFYPAGNSIAAPTNTLKQVCQAAKGIFPQVQRQTVYGSAKYILEKGLEDLKTLAAAGLSRVHLGLESGHEDVLAKIKKGADRKEQIQAGRLLGQAQIENSTYAMLGIGGRELSQEHALATASALNEIAPEFVRLRTFVPKVNTSLLKEIQKGKFQMAGPHEVLRETKTILENLNVYTNLRSDHYTNYINLRGELPKDRDRLLKEVDKALQLEEKEFRPFFVGTE